MMHSNSQFARRISIELQNAITGQERAVGLKKIMNSSRGCFRKDSSSGAAHMKHEGYFKVDILLKFRPAAGSIYSH